MRRYFTASEAAALIVLPEGDISEAEEETDDDDISNHNCDTKINSDDECDILPLSQRLAKQNPLLTFETLVPDDNNSGKSSGIKVGSGDTVAMSRTKSTTLRKTKVLWKTKEFLEPETTWIDDSLNDIDEQFTPLHYFRQFFSLDVFQLLVDNSNLYSVQKDPSKPANVSISEMEAFVAILICMGNLGLPSTRMYWNSMSKVNLIADAMSVNRFETIKRFLHVSDNSLMKTRNEDGYDRLFKVRPLLDIIRNKCMKYSLPEHLSIDEQMIPFKGTSSLKQYLPKKPNKWGFKVFVMASVSGFMHNFEFYTGKDNSSGQSGTGNLISSENLTASSAVVTRLASIVPQGKNYKLYFDNWFTSIDLQVVLAKKGIWSLGTVRANRLQQCPLKSDKDLKKQGRGSFDFRVGSVDNTDLCVLKWNDSNCVIMMSTFAGPQPVGAAKRWSTSNAQQIEIPKPAMVHIYNQNMGGVDLLDSLVSLYRIRVRSKKYYHRIIYHYIDVVLVNSWLLYRNDMKLQTERKVLPLLEFRSHVAHGLIGAGKEQRKRGRPSNDYQSPVCKRSTTTIPIKDIRTDAVGHWPIFNSVKGRCKVAVCSGFTHIFCEKCKVHACLTREKNCFKKFHM